MMGFSACRCIASKRVWAGMVLCAAAPSLGQAPGRAGVDFYQFDPAIYRAAAQKIIESARGGHQGMKKLEELCDDIGHRVTGSPALEQAAEWAVRTMQADGLENCRGESVMVPRWVRGHESAEMTEPRRQALHLLGLGGTIGTPAGGLTAEVLVVRDKEELDRRASEAAGKIVLFNFPMRAYDATTGAGYGEAVRYRGRGASWAAEKGAVACLIRSVTARSLRSPHTGMMRYEENIRKIPAAALSVEDAEMLSRLAARGKRVVVTLNMEARDEGMSPAANAVGELRGRERPDEIVVISGHLDSWDVGQGAMDDGGGCVMSMEAAALLKRCGLIPRRTIRVVLWAGEENGLWGAKQYAKDHERELSRHFAAVETDSGVFAAQGFSVGVSDKKMESQVTARLKLLLEPLSPIGATRATGGNGGADISVLEPAGVPLLGLDVEGSTYFDYHHTDADTFDKIRPADMRDDVIAMAYIAYALAELPTRIDAPDAR